MCDPNEKKEKEIPRLNLTIYCSKENKIFATKLKVSLEFFLFFLGKTFIHLNRKMCYISGQSGHKKILVYLQTTHIQILN